MIALLAGCALMAVAHGPYYTFFSIYLVERVIRRRRWDGCGRWA